MKRASCACIGTAKVTGMVASASRPLARLLGRAAALLLVLGLFTGFLVAAAMTGNLDADPHAMLAAHLNALLGAFWMLGVAWSLPRLRLEAPTLPYLVWLTIVPNFGNWLITAVKAFIRVAGVAASNDPKNNAIFGALTVLVVLPSLAGASIWLWGFRGSDDPE